MGDMNLVFEWENSGEDASSISPPLVKGDRGEREYGRKEWQS
jgi:hypothetical protein